MRTRFTVLNFNDARLQFALLAGAYIMPAIIIRVCVGKFHRIRDAEKLQL